MDPKLEEKRKDAVRIGNGVIILLAVFTLGEYWLGAVAGEWWAILLGIALFKAFFVVRDYMHIGRVFAGDEESH
jgi:hypothetical protein